MEENKKLILSHVFLYAKGWYKRTKNLWEGYLRCINADGHYMPFNRHDVAYLLLKLVTENKKILLHRPDDDMYIYDQIHERIDNLVHWYPKDIEGLNAAQIYDTAVILFCHSVIKFTDKDIFGQKFLPDESVLPLKLNKEKNESKKQARKRAIEAFGEDAKSYDITDDYCKRHFESFNEYYPFKDFVKEYKVEFVDTVLLKKK